MQFRHLLLASKQAYLRLLSSYEYCVLSFVYSACHHLRTDEAYTSYPVPEKSVVNVIVRASVFVIAPTNQSFPRTTCLNDIFTNLSI